MCTVCSMHTTRTKSSDGSGVLLSLFTSSLRSTLSASSSTAALHSLDASGRSSPSSEAHSPSPSCASKPVALASVVVATSADTGNSLRQRAHSQTGHDSGDSRV